MDTQVYNLAVLAYIDECLDELHEEFGDLPEQVKEKDKKADSFQSMVNETEKIYEEIQRFCATTKITLIEMKDKEEKLAKQQFKVRNNREFDAITKEIAHLRSEHSRLTEQLRIEAVKELNLTKILEQQKSDLEEAISERDEKRHELEKLASDQNDEVKDLYVKRKLIVKKVDAQNLKDYDRIRKFHGDAAVRVRKNSCSGCFSLIPQQIIVELRNNLNKLYFCENCGRIMYPEEILITDKLLDEL